MQKKIADQEVVQKQLAESQAREAALRKEMEAIKAKKTNGKSKKLKNEERPL